MSEIRIAAENMPAKHLKNELEYLWEDYKWPILAGAAVAFVVLFSLVTVLTGKEQVLSVMLIDCHTDTSPERMEEDFFTAFGFDSEKQQAEFLTSLLFSDAGSGSYTMSSLSRFLSDIGSEKLDVCAMQEEDFLKYDKSRTWMDLRELLPEEILSDTPGLLTAEDGRVIGLYTDTLPVLRDYGCYESNKTRGVIGVLYNAPHSGSAGAYLRFLKGAVQ